MSSQSMAKTVGRHRKETRSAHPQLSCIEARLYDVSVSGIRKIGRDTRGFHYVHIEKGRLASRTLGTVVSNEFDESENIAGPRPVSQIVESLVGRTVEALDAIGRNHRKRE